MATDPLRLAIETRLARETYSATGAVGHSSFALGAGACPVTVVSDDLDDRRMGFRSNVPCRGRHRKVLTHFGNLVSDLRRHLVVLRMLERLNDPLTDLFHLLNPHAARC